MLKNVFEKAPAKTDQTIQNFVWAEVLRTKSCSLPMKNLSLNVMRLFAHEAYDKKRLLAVRVESRAERLVRQVLKQFFYQPAEKAPRASGNLPPLTQVTLGLCKSER